MNEKPVRVAHIMGKLSAGGVESVVFNYYQHIDHTKYQFDIYYDDDSTVDPPQQLRQMGARFFQVPRYQNLAAYLRALIRLFRQEQYRIVHSHLNTLSVFPLFAAWFAGVPIRIAHSHSTIIKGEGLRTLMKYGLRPFVKLFATHYAACSLAAAESLFGKAAAEGKVSLLKNAIDPAVFAFNADVRAQTRKKLGLTNELLIGHVGRFVYAKNHRFLIEIFHEMLKLQADCRLLLVGDGPLMPQIKEHVQALGLNGQVGFTGLQANVSAYYQAFDLFVMPSHYEGLPVVLLEAQAAGLPVIASPAIPDEAFVTGDHLSITLQEDVGHWARNSLAFAAAHVPGTRSDGSPSIIQSGYAVSEAAGTFLDFYDGLLIDR